MASLLAIIAAALQAGSFTLDKVILSIRGVNYRTYTGLSYPLIFAITLVVFLLVRPPFSLQLVSGHLMWFFLALIILSVVTNLIFYRALDHDRLGEIQTIDLFGNLPTILVATFLFNDERNLFIIVPAMVASCALVWAHWQHHRLVIARGTVPFVVWTVTGHPLAASVSKLLLRAWNPIVLELMRSGAMAVVLGFIFSHEIKKASLRTDLLLVITNILTTLAFILFYFSYQRLGIVHTTLLFSLQPILVYIASLVLLKEKLQPKKLVAFCIVLICIIVAQTMTAKPRGI